MAKYSFHDDYSEGAHPEVLEALALTNRSQQAGYGADEYSEDARRAIRALIGDEDATILFTPGGTGANLLAIASHLRPHEAAIAAELAHIVGKETGAIEATGHKVITEVGVDGRVKPETIQCAYEKGAAFAPQVKPKMVFVSNATEVSTVYTLDELEAVAAICKKLKLFFFLDGARLGSALVSPQERDVFWLGGTENGALLGEAVVIKDPDFGADFPYHMKQRGQLLAKGRVLGVQFRTLLQYGLLFRLARHANATAAALSSSLVSLGFKLWMPTDSNQVFVIFPPALVQELQRNFVFFVWEHLDDGNLVVRLLASWATEILQVKAFCKVVEDWMQRA